MFFALRQSAATRLFVAGAVVALVVACDRDIESPNRLPLHPSGAKRTVSYAHVDNGPCYVWGQDPDPTQPYAIGGWGINQVDTTCGVRMWFEAGDYDRTADAYVRTDTQYLWYRVIPPAGTQAIGTIWKSGPHIILGDGSAWPGQTFPTGLDLVMAHFGRPVKAATVRFRCPIVTGFHLVAYTSDYQVLEKKPVPTVPPGGATPCGAYPGSYSDVTITVSNPPYIAHLFAVGPPPGTIADSLLAHYVGVEFWIVPDSSSRLQVTVSGSLRYNGAYWVGDTIRYVASATDGSAVTVTGWTWTADAGTSPPPGMTEKLSVSACNANGKKPNPCPHTPLTSGTIKVYGTINRKSDSASRHINVTLPRLVAICGPLMGGDPSLGIAPGPAPGVPVTRGDSVTCLGGGETLTEWTFTADDPAAGTITRSTNLTDHYWSGPAVASGIVTVKGTVHGVAAVSDTGRIIVTPRTAGFRFQIDTARAADGAGDMQCFATRLWSPPDSAVAWTSVPHCVSPPLSPSPFRTDTINTTAKRVPDGGPNGGLWYLDSLGPTKVLLRSTVLKDLRSDADAYPVDVGDLVLSDCVAAGQGSPLTPLVVDSVCKKNTGPTGGGAYRLHLYRHEGCHMAVHSSYVNDSTAGPRGALEALVRRDSVTSAGDARIFLQVIENLSRDRSRGVDTLPPSTFSMWGPISAAGGWNFRDSKVPGFSLPPLCP